jgi:serine/threonine-protein kinase
VPASSDKLSALLEANRRLARLAISWFAVDAVQIEKVLRAVQKRQSNGENVDFPTALADAAILTHEQAARLRLDHPPPTEIEIDPVVIPWPDQGKTAASDDDDLPLGAPRSTKLDPPTVNGCDTGEPTQMGPYRILRKLGQGGMGAVYLAFDSKENRQVAIKVLAADQAPKQNILRRFQLEGRHGAALAHDNIVRSFDMGQDPATSLHYIVLEYVDGPTAHELLERTGKMQVGDALHIILDIARALEHAHRNQIIHRDVKPANILLTLSGLAKLSDLGLAKRRDDSTNLTHATQGIGTPYYMPYEQAMNAKKADERSDIYALGATLFHLLTGEVPFDGASSLEIVEKKGRGVFPPARTLNPDVPEKLDEILMRMLARDPDNRYPTVSEVIVDLERTGLAAAVPSFVSLDSALQDPVVRQRLTSPIAATQPDLNLKRAIEEKQAPDQKTWFLRYRDQRGNLCKLKASAAEIVERLKKGTIPLQTEAAHSAQEKFKPLEKWPEFQKAVAALPIAKKAQKRKEPPPAESKPPTIRWQTWWWLAAAVVALGIVAILLLTVYLYLRST